MQLDTHVRGLLAMMAASGRPKMWEVTPIEARKMGRLSAQMVDAKEAIGRSENGALPDRGWAIAVPDSHTSGAHGRAACRHCLFPRRRLGFRRT